MKVLKNISLRKKLEKESSDLQKEVNKLIKTMNTNLQRERLRQKRPPPKAAGSNPAPKPAPEQPEREVFTLLSRQNGCLFPNRSKHGRRNRDPHEMESV